ncbi:DUF5133 domain-containing protein [Streptomyces sp. SDT5-1]|uniref:DUF5133 domain-containing protein n=1 Tax=Streptomyces sp. SDT5-1 TaxID=3406418 RepID=UPI003FCFECF7
MGTSRVTAEARRCLARYRFWQRRFLAAPADPRARAAFGRAVAELCRATGERCGREAAEAASRPQRGDTPRPRDIGRLRRPLADNRER